MTEQPLHHGRAADIVRVLHRLRGVDPTARVHGLDGIDGDDALGEIARGVNGLADDVAELHRLIDRRVADRTAELATARAEMQRRAQIDALTGLANRSLLTERIASSLVAADATARPPCVLLLDLDGFKNINDGLGHGAGDAVLVTVAARLLACVRPTDMVARLGGDEFAVVLPDAGAADAMAVAERIVQELRLPIRVGWRTVWTGASVGVCAADHGQSVDRILRNADTAMYAAKAAGRDRVRLFRPQMHAAARRRLRTASEIGAALVNGHLRVRYRPEVDLRHRGLLGAEAVVQWAHPVRGLLGAAEFLDVAEDSGHIVDIGRWVRRTAIGRVAAGLLGDDRLPDRFRLKVHVSSVELRTTGLAQEVRRDLEAAQVDPGRLVLIVRESSLYQDGGLAELERLRRHGITVQVDGFGTGDSSLTALRRHPVDALRIDASLVASAVSDRKDARYVAALVELARSVDLRVSAAGVDSAADARAVIALGCTVGQGAWCGSDVAGLRDPAVAGEANSATRYRTLAGTERAAG